ncbi:bifunctional 2-polyprenyl-6-hydroxyphenol methylase/3-demethylubiquinol 3-O-methyltransferase UbiG [Phenylobacterium sp.]|uniref:class I SAM-dependent methyltransferase n=1 Tax=Phenylobacterium sp. TaxID=1871053 RepID=UPI0025E050B3|nr:class I SAM-dependent methyltransferase [Phenylobacterium sp.]
MGQAWHITLDPPYVLDDTATSFTFRGWTEVDDEDAPDVEVRINDRAVPVELSPRPQVRRFFPGLQVRSLAAAADFREILAGCDTQQGDGGFLLRVSVRSNHRERTFEYAVSDAWMAAVFGPGLKARPVAPANLQIRVAGAAAGAFCSQGEIEARRLEALAAAAGQPIDDGQTVLDFGCGPGRLVSALAPRHRETAFCGADIDAEAIGWCRSRMGDLGAFAVNQPAPPLPYDDGAFDLVYSLSTFTHMPADLQFAWLDELRRVLKRGRLLITTIMNPFAYDLPAPLKAAAAKDGFVYWGDAPETEGLPSFYRLAYHTHDYVRRAWARGFEVLAIGGHDLNDTQDSVLLRRV